MLLLSQDPCTLDRAANALNRHLPVQLRCSSTLQFRLDGGDHATPDLVVLDVDGVATPDALVEQMRSRGAAVICVARRETLPELVSALRGTPCPILLKPLSMDELVESARVQLTTRDRTVRLAAKYRSMRELVRRAVRERRDLNSRIELVCRDLVDAHKRLTHRVVEIQKAHPLS